MSATTVVAETKDLCLKPVQSHQTKWASHRDKTNSSSVFLPRMILGFVLVTGIFFPSLYQSTISAFYTYLYNSKLYNLSTIETIEIFLIYITIEPLYTVKFTRNPSLRIDVRGRKHKKALPDEKNPRWPKMRRPSRRLKEMIIYAAPLLLMDLTMIKKYPGVPVTAIRQSGGYAQTPSSGTYTPLPSRDGPISSSFLAPTLHNFRLSSPLQLVRALPPSAPSSQRILLELLASFFIYDSLFFFIHVAFHHIPILHRIHQPHHTHAEINPQVTNRLSVAERVSLILLANFSLNAIGAHVLTRSLFVPFFVYLLIEVHCGLDLEWGYEKIMPFGMGAGSAKHAVHHREGEGAYQPFFCWWDKGLEWLKAQRRAA